MPQEPELSREPLSEALAADHGDARREVNDSDDGQPLSGPTGEAPASLEQAEAEAAEAEARAAAARAHALRLRLRAEQTGSDQREGEVRDVVGREPAARSPGSRRRWLPRPRWKAVAVGAAIVLICASLGASGYMVWHHHTVLREQHRAAEFSAVARQSVVTLMSVDANKATEYVQRVIDNSTGKFKEDMQATADDLTKAIGQSKVSTRVNVDRVAVQSMTDDSAVVLVAAKSDLTSPDSAKQGRQSWRISITLERDGDRIKISKVEFV
jgi:Mce-associated membrane protein